ncbi:MAG: beta-1,6-N-acetylglucosaminyltransferase [Gammaproteobacteria bacterium]|nr:beta-1,6-N-acetylglucosaminyltransferase [Gammaproteobacteria bacterium]
MSQRLQPHNFSNEGKSEECDILVVYLILAHDNPDMLGRLINALDSKQVHFFIHIDKKSDIRKFLPCIPEKQNVHLSENRVNVSWGGYSQVQATLNLMDEVLNSGIDFKYAALLSGTHYPIKSNAYIFEKLSHSTCEYLQFCEVAEAGSEQKINAYCLYDYALFNPRATFSGNGLLNKVIRIPGAVVNRVLSKVIPIFYQRRLVRNITPYTGANWWTLTKPCIKYIIDYSKTHKDYVDFFRFSIQPDETFFHTIICNSTFNIQNGDITLRDLTGRPARGGKFSKLRGLSLTYTKCSPIGDPKTLSIADLKEVSSELNYFGCPQLFARKFDPVVSRELIGKIDNDILGNTC